MRQTANVLRVYRIDSQENVNMEIQLFLSSAFYNILEKMMIQQNIEFHGEAIKILNEMLDNYDYE